MSITVEAVFENGLLKPKQPLELAEGAEVRLVISPLGDDRDSLDEVIGICTEGPDISLAEHHDAVIYGDPPRLKADPP